MWITASDKVRQMVADGDYFNALKKASGFRLGIPRDDIGKMKRAYECHLYPEFYRSIGKCPDAEIAEGIYILKTHYDRKESKHEV